MKRFIIVSLFAASCLLACWDSGALSGQNGSISGKVHIQGRKTAVPAALIVVKGTNLRVIADDHGAYEIKNVPPGSYEICATAPGYKPLCITALTIASGQTTMQHFAMEADTLAVEPGNEQEGDKDEETSVLDQLLGTLSSPKEAKKMQFYSGRSIAADCVMPSPHYPPAHGGNTPPNGAPVDAMFFEHYGVNPFVSTEDDHLSTFAIDVDNGSYTMTRSYLNDGNLPPKDAVRVEEFINNFKYNYNHPREDAFTVSVEGAPSKFGKEYYKLIKIGIAGQKIDDSQRRDANLVFVVDVSGSMGREDRLGAVRKSLRLLLDQLTPRDRVGIVAYGSTAFKILDPTSVTERETLIAAIEKLYPSGSTNAEAGIRMGYQMLDGIFDRNKINRIILCSDGVANVGQTAAEDLIRDIKTYADKGITLSAIGFGMGNYNDVFMEKLGNKGNGHYAYVDSWSETRRVFVENLTGMLQVIARDVKIQVDFNPKVVDRYRLLGYENRDVADEKFRDDKEDGGEIGSGHMVTALYEVRLKEGVEGDIGTVYIRYKDPQSFAVTEINRKISQNAIAEAFHKTSSDFRLAAASAEFAEIMRESYWADGSDLADVLAVLRTIENEDSNEQIIELMNLVAQADKLKDAKDQQDVTVPLGMNE